MISHEEIMESNFSTRMEVLQEEINEKKETRIQMIDQMDTLIHKYVIFIFPNSYNADL